MSLISRASIVAATLVFLSFSGALWYSGDAGNIAGGDLEFMLEHGAAQSMEETILRGLASRRVLAAQRAFVTIPVLSSEVPVRKLSSVAGYDLEAYFPKFSLNFENHPSRALSKYGIAGFGGVTLYDDNIYGYAADRIRALTDRLKAIYSTRIAVHVGQGGAQKDFAVVIRPIIAMDCDFHPVNFRYCRQLRDKYAALDLPREELHARIAAELENMGFDTPLSPEADLPPGGGPAESATMTGGVRRIVKTLAAHRLIPVAKHFLFDWSGDPHEEEVQVTTPLERYPLWLAPYAALEESGRPYFLMVTHHSLLLDPGVALPLSLPAMNYIRARFPSAVIMADDVKMRGLPRRPGGISSTVAQLKTDVFLYHLGNIMPSIAPVIEGLAQTPSAESEEAVYRLLSLKWKMGILTIEPVPPAAPAGPLGVSKELWSEKARRRQS